MVDMKPGVELEEKDPDTVRPSLDRRLKFLGDKVVVFEYRAAGSGDKWDETFISRASFDRLYRVKQPFFEEGETYYRDVDWSIPAQARNVREKFEVELVRVNDDDGSKIAFGRFRAGSAGRGGVDHWEIRGQYEFTAGGWTKQGTSAW